MIGIFISNLYTRLFNGIQAILNINKVVAPNNFLIAPWSDTNVSAKTQQSDNSWDLTFDANGELSQSIEVVETLYTVSLYVKNLPADATLKVDSVSPSASLLSQVIGGASSGTLTRIDYQFTVTSGITDVVVSISSVTGGSVQIKNVQVNKGTLKNFVDITKYYVSHNGNDSNTGLSSSSPWRNSAKIQSLSEGNSVYFERGGTYGQLTIPNSGISGKKVNITAYGTGAKPKFRDSVLASGWVDEGGNVHSYTNANLSANLLSLLFDGALKAKGRTPNYVIDSHSGNTTITSSSLTGTPNYTGAEVVIRKNDYIYNLSVIEGQATSTITYGSDLSAGDLQYEPIDGYGFFIQNHSSLLTAEGDWWYDGATKKLYMYFSDNNPALHTVELPLVENAIIVDGKDYVDISDVMAEVTNSHGILIDGSSNISMSRVEARFCFNDGVSVQETASSNVSFDDGVIEDCHTGGFYSFFNNHYMAVRNSVVRNIGLIIGAGGYYGNADSRNNGITVQPSTENIVTGNRVSNIGYCGISPNGSGTICEDNTVDNFCLIKKDGGGIYSSIGGSGYVLASPMFIRRNVCTNGVGYTEMSGNPNDIAVHGIYMDDNQHNTRLQGNFSSGNAHGGLYLHNNTNVIVDNNNVFSNNSVCQVKMTQNFSLDLNNIVLSDNILSCLSYDQLLYEISSDDGEANLIGTFSNNKYYVVRGGMQYFSMNNGVAGLVSYDIDFDDFKTVMGTDSTSVLTEYQDINNHVTVNSTVFTQLYPDEASITAFALGGFTFLDKITTSLVADLDTNAAKLDINGVGNAFAYMRTTETIPSQYRRVRFSSIAPATEKIFMNYELSWSSPAGPRRSRSIKVGTSRTEHSLLFNNMVARNPNDVLLWMFPQGFTSITIDNVVDEIVTFSFTPDIVNVYNNSDVDEITNLGANYTDLITNEVVSLVTLAPGEFRTLIKV